MKKRKLGIFSVSSIGLGCMGLSQAYGVQNDETSIRTLHRAVELGVNFFDTAEVYGPWRNESLLGKALRPYRHEITIATKFGFTFNRERTDFGEITGTNGTPKNARSVAEASLKRLQTDVIDLYYLHRVDPAVPIEESIEAMAQLVNDGKVRAIGLSEVSAETLRRAHKIHPITAVQSEYSLWTRDVEKNGILDACRELGISFVPFSPLGRGFLTGKMPSLEMLEPEDLRHTLPRFQTENIDANRKLVMVIEDIASNKGITAAQLALAWLLAKGENIIPIPGAKRIDHLEQNFKATSIEITKEECCLLDKTFSPENISGERYSSVFKAMTQK